MIELVPTVALAAPGEVVTGYEHVIRLPPDHGITYAAWSPSTKAIAAAMISHDLTGATVLDYGTGSGVLAVLALLVGARHVTATEYIPEIAEYAARVFEANGVSDRVTLARVDDGATAYDAIVANVGRAVELVPLVPRCEFLIGSAETMRKVEGRDRVGRPVFNVTAAAVQAELSARGRTPRIDLFDDGWGVVRG